MCKVKQKCNLCDKKKIIFYSTFYTTNIILLVIWSVFLSIHCRTLAFPRICKNKRVNEPYSTYRPIAYLIKVTIQIHPSPRLDVLPILECLVSLVILAITRRRRRRNEYLLFLRALVWSECKNIVWNLDLTYQFLLFLPRNIILAPYSLVIYLQSKRSWVGKVPVVQWLIY